MRPETAMLIYPLVAAMIYVCSALLVKRASSCGIGVWRTVFVLNWIMAGVFSLLWLAGGTMHAGLLWQPFVVAVLFVLGQMLQLLALDRGDVSVAIPLFGLKVLLVPLASALLFHETIPRYLWLSAILSLLGLTFLNRKDEGRPPRNLGITLFGGGLGSLSFALVDVFVKQWSPAWGAGRFLPLAIGMGAVLSLALVPFFKAPLCAIPRPVWKWLVPGGLLMGAQSVIFINTIAVYGSPTSANILYSSRGLWSVLGVWLIGHWFANDEQNLGARVLRWRLIGALFMTAAIVLVIT